MNIDTHGLINIDASTLIGQSVAILGIKGSGKSNTAAVLMEELLEARIPICVVDIAGEYYTLRERFPQVTVIGRSITTKVQISLAIDNTWDVAEAAYLNASPVVLDLSGVDPLARDEMMGMYFRRIYNLAALHRIPLVIFLEEAHNFVPQRRGGMVTDLFIDIAAEGRKRGLSLVMVGQRSARIHKDTLTQADVALLHRVRHPTDLNVYCEMIPRPRNWVRERVNRLKVGDALLLVGEQIIAINVRRRHTRHGGATPGLDDIPKQMSLLDVIGRKQ